MSRQMWRRSLSSSMTRTSGRSASTMVSGRDAIIRPRGGATHPDGGARAMTPSARRLAVLVVAASAAGCDFQPDPAEGPVALAPTRVADVRIEYRQPQGCENANSDRCVDLVWFFGSWMHNGEEVSLDIVP